MGSNELIAYKIVTEKQKKKRITEKKKEKLQRKNLNEADRKIPLIFR